MDRVYLDNSATTKISDDVKQAMLEAIEVYGNPSSFHKEGRAAKSIVNNSIKLVAKLIGAKPDEIIFTSGGTESNNTILNIAGKIIEQNSTKNEIIVSQIEHPSILKTAKELEARGIKVHYLPVDKSGRLKIDELKKIINDKVALASIMLANNEIGTIQNIAEIAKICHQSDVYIHSDIVQAIGKIPVNVKQLDIDYASLSAHKISGPKGIGALYVNKSAPYYSFINGGGQENKKRAGTENVVGIAGFGAAAAKAIETPEIYSREILGLKNKLQEKILNQIPNATINEDKQNSLPNILNVSFAGAEGESILLALDHYGIAVSTGSACASGDAKPSHVLMAIEADPELAHGSIRFSFGLNNTTDDVEKVMKYLPNIIKNLREISTIGVK